MMKLGDFTSTDRLEELVENLTNGGKNINRFENLAIQNILKWKLAGADPMDNLLVYGFPVEKPLYVFIIELSDKTFPQMHVRTKSDGHDRAVLAQGLRAIYAVLLPYMEKHDELLLDADATVRKEFLNMIASGKLPLTVMASGDLIPFYIDESQKEALLQLTTRVPDGFYIDTINVEKEHRMIHAALTYADAEPEERTRLRLEHLPSVCIRDSAGKLASWQMSHHYGLLTHLYAVHGHRGKGIGSLAEDLLAKKFAQLGLCIFKYVDYDNEFVFRGTTKHPLWKRWRSTNEKGEEDDVTWSYSIYKLSKLI